MSHRIDKKSTEVSVYHLDFDSVLELNKPCDEGQLIDEPVEANGVTNNDFFSDIQSADSDLLAIFFPDTQSADGDRLAFIMGSLNCVEDYPIIRRAAREHFDPKVRKAAVQQMGMLSFYATISTEPILLNQIEHRYADCAATLAAAAFEDSDSEVRLQAIKGLVDIAPREEPCLKALVGLIDDDPDPVVREWAISAFREIGLKSVDVAQSLIRALTMDNSWEVRGEAARGLAEFGPEAKDVIPALIRALTLDNNWAVRGEAARALAEFGSEAKDAIPALVDLLLTGRSKLRDNYTASHTTLVQREAPKAAASGEMHDPRNKSIPDTGGVSQIEDGSGFFSEDPSIRSNAAFALGAIGPLARSAIPALAQVVREYLSDVSEAAAEALWKIDVNHLEVILAFLEASYDDPDLDYPFKPKNPVQMNSRIALSLGILGLPFADIIRSHSRKTETRQVAVAALKCVAPDVAPSLPLLQQIIAERSGSWSSRTILNYLMRLGTQAGSTIPILLRNAAEMPEAFNAIVAIDSEGEADARNLRHSVLMRMFDRGSDPMDVLSVLYKDPWLVAKLSRIAQKKLRGTPSFEAMSAEDLTSNFFLWLHTKRLIREKTMGFDLRRHKEFAGWITKIFSNYLENALKRRRGAHNVHSDTRLAEAAAPYVDPASQLDPSLIEQVQSFIRTELNERQRNAVRHRFFAGFSCKKTADMMGLTPNQVDYAVEQGLDAIRRRFGARFYGKF